MLSTIIFSKNRPMQLQLLLRSIEDNFKELSDVHILYKHTSEDFKEGYEKVISQFPYYRWINEVNLKKDILNIIEKIQSKFILFMVDDEVVINDYSIKPAIDLLQTAIDVHTVSLRLHQDITYTYTANIQSPTPNFEHRDGLLLWNWKESNPISDWGYPSCINSHLYSKIFLEYYINLLNFNTVNDLEGYLNLNRSSFKPKMACFPIAKTFNIANNLVQIGYNRYSENKEYTPENLNKYFLNDYQISTKNLYGLKKNTATGEVDYEFEKVYNKYLNFYKY
ncbi:MAG TPA: hypothetical protein PLI22_08785 [Caldisericia bacterium]|nr:hypothetical protein [Caldisericia bacterium]